MTCMEKVHVQRCTDNEFIYILRVFPHNTYSTLSALIHVHIMEDQVWWEGESTESMGGSPGDVSENPVTQEKRKKGWRMSCDVGKAREGLENEL